MQAAHQIGLYDAHCHPTDIMCETKSIPEMKAKALTIMATRAQDQDLIRETAEAYPISDKADLTKTGTKTCVVPSFGWHPWFAHQIFDDRKCRTDVDHKEHYCSVLMPEPDDEEFLQSLPKPRPLSQYLAETEARLLQFPLALVGEIGLDRPVRVPYGLFLNPDDLKVRKAATVAKTGGEGEGQYTPGSREGRPLTPYRISLKHQKLILKAQLELAAKHRRAVSIHSVATHGVLFDILQALWKGHEKPSKSARKKAKKDADRALDRESESSTHQDRGEASLPYPPRICMHSYSGPPDALKQFLGPRVPADIFFSFSELVNFGSHNSEKAVEVVRAVPDDKILIESDLHCAGREMDQLLESIFGRVCRIKGWGFEEGAEILRKNWLRFVFGDDESNGGQDG